MTIVGAIKDAYDKLEAKGDALIAQLEEKGHELAGELRAWFEAFTGRLPAIEAEAKADAEQVVKDVETAAAPAVAEVKTDVKHLGEYATGGFIPGPRSPA